MNLLYATLPVQKAMFVDHGGVMVQKPEHMTGDSDPAAVAEDGAGWFPTPDAAMRYHTDSNKAYHENRLRALRLLAHRVNIEGPTRPLDVLDFGIGDASELSELGFQFRSLLGIDISPHMIDLAKTNVDVPGGGNFLVGSVEQLAAVPSESLDLILATNVMGYLTESQERNFFAEAARLLRPTGYLMLMTGNELFDLFALNSGTGEFFRDHFGVEGADRLLAESGRARFKNARRHNPLRMPAELSEVGFAHLSTVFAQWHWTPPLLLEVGDGLTVGDARLAARDQAIDPNSLPSTDEWKALFQCSIFGALFQRTEADAD